MNQLDLFTIKRAWIDSAEAKIALYAPGTQFSSDAVYAIVAPPEHHNWVGCLFARLSRRGKLKEVGRIKSLRPSANGRKISLYEVQP